MELIVRPEAEQDLEEAADWYQDRDVLVRPKFIASVEKAFARIVDNPKRFPPAGKGMRRATVRGFPYSIYFVADDTRIIIAAVLHHRRDGSVLADRLN